MNWLDTLLRKRRMVLTAALTLSVVGFVAWFAMPRQEDPDMRDYWGNILTTFPGADAEIVERLILEPIEEHLAEVEGVLHWDSTAMAESALIHLELETTVRDVEKTWDDVRKALDQAFLEFPEGAGTPVLDTDLNDQESIVLAVTGGTNRLHLAKAAKSLKRELLTLKEVAAVRVIADPGEQITIEYDDTQARHLNLDPVALAQQLSGRSRIMPGGSIKVGGKTVTLRPRTEFESLDEIRSTPIILPTGSSIPLELVANVRYGPLEPVRTRMRFNGAESVGLGVIAKDGVHLLDFGSAVRAKVAAMNEQLAPIEVHQVEYQPERVQRRLNDLGRSLLLGILIIALVLLLSMGPRLGLIVSSVVPLVAFASLGLYAAGGGVLHQISIAALVIALGMLVDNAIVVAENVQWRIEQGEKPHAAALQSVRELAAPLGSATATTLAAFVPMLVSEGTTAEFTRALPIVIMLTLTVSYLFAIFVTPTLSELFLKPQGQKHETGLDRISGLLARISARYSILVLASAGLLVMASLMAAGLVKKQFFPVSDRNQVVVEIKLAEGAHLDETDQTALRLERELLDHSRVVSVASFIGRSAPHFYYNLDQIPWRPHYAQLVVNTIDLEDVEEVLDRVRQFGHDQLTDAEVIPRRLEQGPPVRTPIEVRVYGKDLQSINSAADMILERLRAVEGTIDSRQDMSLGAPMLQFKIDDAAAGRHGVNRVDVARALYGRTRGLPVGQFRAGEDPVPVVLRSSAGEDTPAPRLESLDVTRPGGEPVPLAEIARLDLDWRPAVIAHHNRRRVVKVSSLLREGYTYSDVQEQLETSLADLALPEGASYEFGGEAEGSDEANTSMVKALPWGLLLLFGILLAEFNSFRRVGIVLVTVPLAAAGVVPGLLLGNQPFGFTSFLGVIALVGVVVNNAIVLLDVIEARRDEGQTVDAAVAEAIARRTRPILLTTSTTVAGLVPLALSSASLWPPLAWAMISGLLASTLLTLVVVPALYLLLFRPRGGKRKGWLRRGMLNRVGAAGLLLGAVLTVPVARLRAQDWVPAPLQRLTLAEAMAAASGRPLLRAFQQKAVAADLTALATRRLAVRPEVAGFAAANFGDRSIEIESPVGDFTLGEDRSQQVNLALVQPIFKPADLLYKSPASQHEAQAAHLDADLAWLQAAGEAAEAFLRLIGLDARLQANDAFISSLEDRLRETTARVAAGRSLEVDALKVQLDLDRARQARLTMQNQRQVGLLQLGRAVGYPGPVEPVYDRYPHMPEPLSVDQAFQLALEHRPDLAALRSRIGALSLRARAVSAEAWPRLEARASYSWANGEPFRNGTTFDGALQLSWKPFAAKTRAPRRAAFDAEGNALEAQYLETRAQIRVDIHAAFAAIETARGAVAVAERGVALTEETLRVERERFENGRTTANDLLAAEAALHDQRADLALAHIELIGAAIRLRLSTGLADLGSL